MFRPLSYRCLQNEPAKGKQVNVVGVAALFIAASDGHLRLAQSVECEWRGDVEEHAARTDDF